MPKKRGRVRRMKVAVGRKTSRKLDVGLPSVVLPATLQTKQEPKTEIFTSAVEPGSNKLVEALFAIRSRPFSANDITLWVVNTLQTLFGVGLERVKTEVVIKAASRGRADILVQDFAGIETKKQLRDELDDALPQVRRILEKFEKEKALAPIGIATDGAEWRFYTSVKGQLVQFFDFMLVPGSTDQFLESSLWSGLTVFRRTKHRPDPTASLVAETFRPFGPAFNEIRAQMKGEISQILAVAPVELTSKFQPWFEMFSHVYNRFQERCRALGKEADDLQPQTTVLKLHVTTLAGLETQVLQGALELYMRHTYLALLAKALTALATLGESGTVGAMLKDPASLLTGELTARHGVHICDPNDFFVWAAKGRDPHKLAGAVLKPLARFSDAYTDDVFRHLYEIVVDPETRHELGEFYTPRWLAELIVRDIVNTPNARVIDPACGSGTFLVAALRRLHVLSVEQKEHPAVPKLLESVWGLDVNPLSVILARTNLYLTAIHLAKKQRALGEIRPQAYVADTFVVPRFEKTEQEKLKTSDSGPIVWTPVTPNIAVPTLPGMHPFEAAKEIERVGGALETGEIQGPEDVPGEEPLADYRRALVEAMKDLRATYGNSLWKYVLRNYGIPPLLIGKFDIVIGNPPWLVYREAKGSIKDTIDAACEKFGVHPPSQVKTSFNLGVAFFLTSTTFLKAGGRIGFVLPQSVLDSPHAAFLAKMQAGKNFRLLKVYDLAEVEPNPFPHQLLSAVLEVEVLQ